MWYGRNAPAPAILEHELHRPTHARHRSTKSWEKAQTWGPLIEFARRRDERQKRRQRFWSVKKVKGFLAARPPEDPSSSHVDLLDATILPSQNSVGKLSSSDEALLLPGSAEQSLSRRSVLQGLESSARPLEVKRQTVLFAPPSGEEEALKQTKDRRTIACAQDLRAADESRTKAATICTPPTIVSHSEEDAEHVAQEGLTSLRTSRERITEVFHQLAVDREITVGMQLTEALALLDRHYLCSCSVHRVLKKFCGGRESLDLDDFVVMVTTLEDGLDESVHYAFDHACCQETELLNPKAVPKVLSELLVPLMPGSATELVRDLCEIGIDVDLASFIRIYQQSLLFAGLTKTEFYRHWQMFTDMAENSLVSVEDLRAKLHVNENFTNLVGGEATLIRLAKETAVRSQAGTLDLDMGEWLKAVLSSSENVVESPVASRQPASASMATVSGCVLAMRVFHELLSRNLKVFLSKFGMQTDRIEPTQIEDLLEKIGFVSVIPETVASYMRAMGMGNVDYLNFDELYSLLYQYGVAQGFTVEEQAEIVSIFKRLDEDGSGTLEVAEMGPVLRWLGYHPTQFRLYNFVAETGLEEDAELNIDQFRELIATYGKINISPVQAHFLEGKGLVEELDNLMVLVGHDVTEEDMEWLLELAGRSEGPLDFSEFKTIERAFRVNICETMARNRGCTDAEAKRYEHYFQQNDLEGEGFITQKAMRKLLENLFPDSGLNKERHLRIAQLVKAADQDGNGMFDLDEFTQLIQRVTEEMDKENLVKGLSLRKELGFSAMEVRQWREMYAVADDDESGAIEFKELRTLLSGLVEIDAQASRELQAMFAEVDDGDGEMDFWEFLRFMKQILDCNWKNINGIVSGAAKR